MFLYLLFSIKYLFYFFISLFQKQKAYKLKQSKQNEKFIPYKTITSSTKKPLWVKNEIIYLKALLPNYGCRKIATIFNKQFHHKNISISKSYVYYITIKNQYKIIQKRKNIKNKKPQVLPKNLLWQIDLTNISDYYKNKNSIFGIIDSGSRAILFLQRLENKSTITILKAIIYSLEKYGKPNFIRTDNEIIFKSKLFKFSLWFLRIKHQTTKLASPWQNGKIERFFNTLKYTTNQLEFYTKEGIDKALHIFRFYYNHIRPHENINYFSPCEIWDNKTDFKYKNIYYFSELDNTIQGFYFIPK